MTRYRNLAAFLVLSILWGSAFVAISAGLEHVPPVLFAAVRYDVAALLMLAYAVVAVDDWRPVSGADWAEVAVGSTLLIAAYHALLFVGQQHTTAGAAAVLVSLSPILTAAFARVFTPEDALGSVATVGLLVGLFGVAVVVRPDPNAVTTDVVARLLIVGAAAAFALGGVLTRRIDGSLPIETMEAWSMLGGALLLHAISAALGEPVDLAAWAAPEALGALVYLSVVSSALGFLIYFDLLDALGSVEVNTVSYVAPVVAAVVGWFYLGDVVDARTIAGFAAIAAGFVLVKRRELAAAIDHSWR